MSPSNFHLQSHLYKLHENTESQLRFEAKSQAEFFTWQEQTRSKLKDLLGIQGRLLATRLKADLLQRLDRETYHEEKYLLQADDGVNVPIYLLIPNTPPPYKAILAFHGHDPSVQYMLGQYPNEEIATKQLAIDANYAQSLAQAGYLVCAVEQRGFGERISEQWLPEKQNTCRHLAFEYMLHGRTLLGERCWDAFLALNFLQNREDVLKDAIGCTGHSGGGATALWLAALDSRIKVTVLSCCLSSYRDSILAMTHCECNYIPKILNFLDMGDIAASISPRSLQIIAGKEDKLFPLQSAQEEFKRIQAAYTLFGQENQVSLAIHPRGHAYNNEMSRTWFDAHL